MIKRILVPVDFSEASSQAARQAASIAGRSGSSLTLLHVCRYGCASDGTLNDRLQALAGRLEKESGISCHTLTREGGIIGTIAAAAEEGGYDMAVVGAHSLAGIRQKILGARILKLVEAVRLPVLVVQDGSPLAEKFGKIVLPVGSHSNYLKAVDFLVDFPGSDGFEVHLYSISKPGFPMPEKMLENITRTERLLEKKGIRLVRVREEQSGFSQGFARQTIRYARSAGADAIWIMSVASEEYRYMAKAYKEAILLNEERIPVFCFNHGPGGKG